MSNITWLFVLIAFAVTAPVVISQLGLFMADSDYVNLPELPEAQMREINEEDYAFSAWNVVSSILNFLATIFNSIMGLLTGLYVVMSILPIGLAVILTAIYFFLIAHIIIKLLPTT